MYFPLKMGMFHWYVSLPECTVSSEMSRSKARNKMNYEKIPYYLSFLVVWFLDADFMVYEVSSPQNWVGSHPQQIANKQPGIRGPFFIAPQCSLALMLPGSLDSPGPRNTRINPHRKITCIFFDGRYIDSHGCEFPAIVTLVFRSVINRLQLIIFFLSVVPSQDASDHQNSEAFLGGRIPE